MDTNLTEIIFILDRSGSMARLESDTIGGYNFFLEKQRKVEGEATITTILFDDKYEILHNGININNVEPITLKEYFVRGSTALLDAIGKTIVEVGLRLNDTPESKYPSKVGFVITTDGYENASREFTYQNIKEMISHQEKKCGWEFIFVAANIDVTKEAENLGIKASSSVPYVADSAGTREMYVKMSGRITDYRRTRKLDVNHDVDIKKRKDKTMD